MPALLVSKSPPLSGEVTIHGAKNSVLPILAATLLCRTPCVLHNCPDILDVTHTRAILHSLGCASERRGASVYIDPRSCAGHSIPPELAASMRASSLFLGALLARQGEASLSLPGGCQLGKRPIDIHLAALRQMGAQIEENGGEISCSADKLRGTELRLPFPSVGATENIMLAATAAEGVTVIHGAAREPEISALASYLRLLGSRITGDGTDTVTVEGPICEASAEYRIIPDRIVASTLACAAAATGGDVELRGVDPTHFSTVLHFLKLAGCDIISSKRSVRLRSDGKLTAVGEISTSPYPGFPTDMQPQITVTLALAEGTSVVTESIFENRFKYVDELARMGGRIKVEGNTAIITGVKKLTGAQVEAPDLRAGAALVIAGLAAEGYTTVDEIGYIQRGYEHFEKKLQGLGAVIEKVDSEKEAQKFRLKVG